MIEATTPTPEEFPGLGINAAQLNALMSAIELMGQMIAGYRAKLVAAGFSDETADRMSETFHSRLMEKFAEATANQSAGPNRRERRHPR